MEDNKKFLVPSVAHSVVAFGSSLLTFGGNSTDATKGSSPDENTPNQNNRKTHLEHNATEEHYATLAQPSWISPRRTVKLDITQQPCYQGAITSKDATLKLQQRRGSCYLVRYSTSQKKHFLSVLKKGDDGIELFQNFVIIITTKHYQNYYEMQGSDKVYEKFSDLLQYYEKYPISSEIDCIGNPYTASNPPSSPNSNAPQADISSTSKSTHSPSQGTIAARPYPRHRIDVQSPEHLNSLLTSEPSIKTHDADTPTMTDLVNFPMADRNVNLAEKIGVHYYTFGILLLNDKDGNKVRAIEKELGKNSYDINCRLLGLWLQGRGRQPVSWAKFTDILQDIGLNKLAKDIEKVKTTEH